MRTERKPHFGVVFFCLKNEKKYDIKSMNEKT